MGNKLIKKKKVRKCEMRAGFDKVTGEFLQKGGGNFRD